MQGLRSFLSHAALSLLALTLVSACSSGPPKPEIDYNHEYNFRNAKTFSLYQHSGQVSGDNPLQVSDMQRNRVDEALRIALENSGLTYLADSTKADLLLSWHLSTQNKQDVRTYQSTSMHGGYGYGGYNRYSMYNCWSCMPTQTDVRVTNYTQGTFIVDMIDPKMKQSVWRSVIKSKLKGKVQDDQGKYNAAAARIFETFPPY